MAYVDCRFHEQPLNKAQILELQLIENLLRDDLKPVEEARAFQSLMEFNGWTGNQLAAALHLPASKIHAVRCGCCKPNDWNSSP